MKRILCPIDFSAAANNAVEYAANLAVHFKSELTLLHVVEELALEPILDSKRKMTPSERERLVQDKVEDICLMTEDSFSIQCKPQVVTYTSNLEDGIRQEIAANAYDLIVMGTNGTSNFEEFLFGTNTYRVIRKIPSPLLLVPEGIFFERPESIVYASDYRTEDLQALESLINLVDKFSSEITVLHISKNQSEKDEEVFSFFQDLYKDKLKHTEIKFQHLINENTAMALDDYMTKNKPNLLVLLTHHYSLTEKIFHDSVTKKMSLVASYPILVNKS